MQAGAPSTKLYQQIARAISAAIADGRYASGERLPSERELADEFSVSRPTIRDAMIALEFQGLVEARPGSGVYVAAATPAGNETDEPGVSALAIAEAQRLFEGEACALAATCIAEDQLASLDRLLQEMGTASAEEVEKLEQDFHLAIARGSGNAAIVSGIEDLWQMRQQSSSCMATLRRVRTPAENSVDEHRKILEALKARDSKEARLALHAHLNRTIDSLLDLAEAEAVEQTRQKMAEQRRALTLRNDL
jgi:GntR family transcriptional regulator, hexuronate regulon transcriptional repressor